MSSIPLFLFSLLIYAIALGLSGIIAKLATHNHFDMAAWISVILTPLLWIGLCINNDAGKTLSNVVLEPAILGVAAMAVTVIYGLTVKRSSRIAFHRVAILCFVGSLLAVLVWRLTPSLPE